MLILSLSRPEGWVYPAKAGRLLCRATCKRYLPSKADQPAADYTIFTKVEIFKMNFLKRIYFTEESWNLRIYSLKRKTV